MKAFPVLLLSWLVLSIPQGFASADDRPPAGCGLTESFFCGVWQPIGKGEEAAGRVTINATSWTWENGDKANCQLLDQGNQGDRHYATFRCTIIWKYNGKEEEQFMRLYKKILFTPEEGISHHSNNNSFHMSKSKSLTCLLDGWNEMLEDRKAVFIKMKPSSNCGRVTTYSYAK
ncbi:MULTISPECIES: hypothetical protein [unclassified Azospirillum]|uniref:hypothetical protein n=1 Tax=unclassified Azospirillum TaxID=2630922 RepID=UPI0011780076|nr:MULTISPECIES: hypothetical protein [unclassified Azospirillum]